MGFTFRQLISRLITSAAERLFSKWIFGGEAKSFGGRYEILRIISQPRTLSATYQQFIHFNLPINFHHETFDSKFLWLFCTFRSRIWNQLFIVTTTGLYQMSSFFSQDKTLKLAFRFFSFFLIGGLWQPIYAWAKRLPCRALYFERIYLHLYKLYIR